MAKDQADNAKCPWLNQDELKENGEHENRPLAGTVMAWAKWGKTDLENYRFGAPAEAGATGEEMNLHEYRFGALVKAKLKGEAAAMQDEEQPPAPPPPAPPLKGELEVEAYLQAQVAAEEGNSGGFLDLNDEDLDSDHVEVASLAGWEWWQARLASVRQRLAALHIHGKLYDVTLVFPKYQSQIKAHKLVLGMSSPVLEAMLLGPLAKFDDEEGKYLTLHDDSPRVFDWLLRYIYRDETNFSGPHQALEVYRVAHKFQMDALVQVCSEYLSDAVDPECFAYVFESALLHNDSELLQRCSQVAAVHGRQVLSSADIVVLSRGSLRTLLTMPQLQVERESFIFRALIEWGWFHLEEELPPPYRSCPALLPARRRLRAMIDEFLPYVRFLAMDLNEFMNEVESTGLLTARECLTLVRAIRSTVAPPLVLPRFVSWGVTGRRRGQLWVVMLVGSRPPSPAVLTYHERISINLLRDFMTTQEVYVVRLACMGLSSLKEGSVSVWDDEGAHVAKGVWMGNGVIFKRPLLLKPSRRYFMELVLMAAYCALVDNVICVSHRRTTFLGETQCGGLFRLEYLPGEKLPTLTTRSRKAPVVCIIENP